MADMIKVGMADLNICHAPDAITTLGLGSCVGVALYDQPKKLAGLVHVMLPALEACVATANLDDYRGIGLYKKLG